MRRSRLRALCSLFLLLLAPAALGETPATEIVPTQIGCYSAGDMGVFRMQALADGGLLLAGSVLPDKMSQLDAIAMRMDAEGNTLWTLTAHTDTRDSYRGAVPLPNGDFVLLLRTAGDTEETHEIIRARGGEIIATEPPVPGNSDRWPELFPAEDGYFVLYEGDDRMGVTGPGGLFSSPVLEKRDGTGGTLWRHTFDEAMLFYSAVAVPDGTVFLGVVAQPRGDQDATAGIAVKMSTGGEMLWQVKSSPAAYRKSFVAGVPMPDGGLLAVGNHYPTTPFYEECKGLAARISPDGEILWEQEYRLESATNFACAMETGTGYAVFTRGLDRESPVNILLLNDAGEVRARGVIPAEEPWYFAGSISPLGGGGLRMAIEESCNLGGESAATDGTTRVRIFDIQI